MDNIDRRKTAPRFFVMTVPACVLAAALAFGQEPPETAAWDGSQEAELNEPPPAVEPAEPPQQKKMKLGVLYLESPAGNDKLASGMAEVMAAKLDSLELYDVYMPGDLDRALADAGIRKPANCRDPKCVQGVAAALGLDRMLYGAVYMRGARYGVRIVLTDFSHRPQTDSVSVEGAEGVPAKHVMQCALDRVHGRESKAYVSKYFDSETGSAGEFIWSAVAVQGAWALYTLINYGAGGGKGVELESGSDVPGLSNQITVFARPSALANAYTAVSGDAGGVFYNPAGMPFAMKREAALAYQYRTDTDVLAASYVNMASGNAGFGQAFLISTGRGSLNTELYFITAAGYRFDGMPVLGPLSVGASVKTTGGTARDVPAESPRELSFGGGLDLGLMWELSQAVRYGAVMRDVISVNRWKNETTRYRYTERLPASMRMGVSCAAGNTALFVLDGQIPLYDDQPWMMEGGVEYEFTSVFALRMGAQREITLAKDNRWKITGGGGLKFGIEPLTGKYLNLDAAYEYDTPSRSHVINVSMRVAF